MGSSQGHHLRIIPRLDVKFPNLVKGVRLEGFRVLGDPAFFARAYGEDGADELMYQDVVASLYERNNIFQLVESAAKSLFVPLSVGGGIRSIGDIRDALRHGADRVVVNTAVVNTPQLVREAARVFGSQCMIASIEAVRISQGAWEPLVNCGRDRTGLDFVSWIKELEYLGAGELLLTSVDREGTRQGLDLEMLESARNATSLPIILHGGAWEVDDIGRAWNLGVSGIVIASAFHYQHFTVQGLKASLTELGIPVRQTL